MLEKKFNDLIYTIEELIEQNEPDIPQALANKTGYSLRRIGEAFQFMTDITLIKYIRQRKMIHALEWKNQESQSIEQTAFLAGFSDAAAFSKAFKNEFKVSPSKASEDFKSQFPPLCFEQLISKGDTETIDGDVMEIDTDSDLICGIPSKHFGEIKTLLELSSVYGFDDKEADCVLRISKKCSIPISQVADFYFDFLEELYYGTSVGPDQFEECVELAMKLSIPIGQSQRIVHEIHRCGYDSISSLPDGFFDVYLAYSREELFELTVSEICSALELMKERKMPIEMIDNVVDIARCYSLDLCDVVRSYDELKENMDQFLKNVHVFP